MTVNLKSILVLVGIFFLCNIEMLAGGPPGPPGTGGGGPPGGCWPPSTCIPIDGGLSFLIAAGVAFGASKVYKVSKDNEADF